MPDRTYTIVQGLWDPIFKGYRWVDVSEHESIEGAREMLCEMLDQTLMISRVQLVTDEHRKAYRGAPILIVETTSRILDRIDGSARESEETAAAMPSIS